MNAKLEILGILLTMCDVRTNLYRDVREALEANFGTSPSLFETYIPYSTRVGEANLNKQSVIEYYPNNKASESYIALSAELQIKFGRCE
ncbi:MAG: hypothetical protein FWH05_01030 [Oscillospiraceae bacterium]|nr:hypothetical protein [Oscillospiraceae bacterium]